MGVLTHAGPGHLLQRHCAKAAAGTEDALDWLDWLSSTVLLRFDTGTRHGGSLDGRAVPR